MATHTSSTLRTYRGSHRRRQDAYRVPIFFMAALLIAVASLFGCGGGVTSTESQPPAVSPVTGSATLTWAAPSTNEDGTPISSLGGYKVYYGTTPGVYTSINVGPASSFQVSGLAMGEVYYFAVSAYDSSGNESDLSEVVSKVIG
jgi:hypothetical protein